MNNNLTFETKKQAQAARNLLAQQLGVNPNALPVKPVHVVTCGRPATTRWAIQHQTA